MKISRKMLLTQASVTDFRPDVLEKVVHLLNLLESLQSHPFLKGKLALKGGTALNLFVFDLPRLSVDIDINYIGPEEKDIALKERPNLEKSLQAVFSREGFTVKRIPSEHAGGKWLLQYISSIGQTGNLEVDVNYMFRIPLWPVALKDSIPLGPWQATNIPMLDIHEIAAGKLAALLSRKQARDLFDCHNILKMKTLNIKQLRIAFVLYGAMNRKDWRTVSLDDVDYDSDELVRQLVPTLRTNHAKLQKTFVSSLVSECRQGLSMLLPLKENEMGFLEELLDRGHIKPEFLTAEAGFQQCILRHPLLQWKAQNVRRHKQMD